VTGYIFAVYSVAVVIASPFVGPLIQLTGRRCLITAGLMLMGTSFISFGAIGMIESQGWFIFCALLSRLFQGLASVSVQVTCYSIAANFYPDSKGMMIGLLEASQGFGLMVGPIIGTGLFALAGYNFMLYSFGTLFLVIGICVYIIIPTFVDSTHQDENHGTSHLDMNVSGIFSY
jgi:MFS transporter, DHA1 family, multidrug resistance protein